MFIFTSQVCANDVKDKEALPSPVLSCELKAKASQASNFWFGTYFDTTIVSKSIKSLKFSSAVDQFNSSKGYETKVELGISDQTIIEDDKGVEVRYGIRPVPKLARSLDSTETGGQKYRYEYSVSFNQKNWKDSFEISKNGEKTEFFQLGKPGTFDYRFYLLKLTCSLK
ncbi:MAG: hypothetical protein ACPGJV_13025 [Bacteriovoracaceae bacterium]